MGTNFVFRCVLFFFVFHAKSGTTNKPRVGSSDILYYNFFSRNSKDNIATNVPGSRKNGFKFLSCSQTSGE